MKYQPTPASLAKILSFPSWRIPQQRQSQPQRKRHQSTNSRRLVLADIENFTRMSSLSLEQWHTFFSRFCGRLAANSTDHLIIGMSTRTFEQAMPALQFARGQLVVQDGTDGADIAICAQVDSDHLAARYGELVIASGDNFFTSVSHDAKAAGLAVRVVSESHRSCSRQLRASADVHEVLPLDYLIGNDGPDHDGWATVA